MGFNLAFKGLNLIFPRTNSNLLFCFRMQVVHRAPSAVSGLLHYYGSKLFVKSRQLSSLDTWKVTEVLAISTFFFS